MVAIAYHSMIIQNEYTLNQSCSQIGNAMDRKEDTKLNLTIKYHVPFSYMPACGVAGVIDACRLTPYTVGVVKSFRHRGLKAFYEDGRSAKLPADHVAKLTRILTALDRSSGPEGMDLPGFRLHRLKGSLKSHYAVSVSGNWRVTFEFENGHVINVDYLDYH